MPSTLSFTKAAGNSIRVVEVTHSVALVMGNSPITCYQIPHPQGDEEV
ncbi:hypothetical protein [Nostoc parmelioides]|uniref:Uncharacterized protein n=1 Tax=Nostoc parmelioides FACHB-3921 TaxID=2692909 RepID=A0ABR8B8M0_9NOSO|nr:hypothetical protein [Nostoc parmelioides]MBD2250280.1 hypothetical protein [Nostoc parmelioides FACHB-3921]